MAQKNFILSILLGGVLSSGVVSDAATPDFSGNSSIPPLVMDEAKQLAQAQISARPKATGRRVKTKSLAGSSPVTFTKTLNRIAATAKQGLAIPPPSSPLLTPAQQDNLQSFASALNGSSSEVRFNWHNGTPSFIKIVGKPVKPLRALSLPRATARDIAAAFLDENSRLLKLDDARQELRLIDEMAEPSGKKHLRYQQQFQGLDVWGQQLALHLNNDGIYLVNGRYTPTPAIATTPGITPEEATLAAKADFGARTAATSVPQLLIYAGNESALLAYKIELTAGLSERWIYFVDARTKKVVNKINNIHTAGEMAAASGQDLQGQQQSFNAWLEDGAFYLVDPSIPSPDLGDPINTGPNPTGDTYILDARNQEEGALSFITSPRSNSNWDPVAVSAMRNTLAVYRYFLDTFQRKSLDDKNKNLMVVVHAGKEMNNAAWNGTYMIYGDGDGKTFEPLAQCLDVAAHEMTHGVTEHAANFVYQNQSGALNESFSDVFAAMVDRKDWTVGEECTVVAPGFVRSLQDPSLGLPPQPGHMRQYKNLLPSEDNGGVHINSGIPNRAAYLLAEGLSAEGLGTSIGREKTEKIYYRALTIYLTASAQFIDARRALIQSAEDLSGAGSAEARAVAAAWDAVGVVEGGVATPDTRTPSSTDAVAGEDVMVYLYPRDDTRDGDVNDIYDLYVQRMGSPFAGYKEENDIGPLNAVPAEATPAAAITDSTGTSIFYTGLDGNIYFVDPAGRNEQLTNSGDVWSISVAPDGRYFAYTTADPADKTIHIIDIESKQTIDFPLQPPDYQQGNAKGLNSIRYADSLAFDYTGTKIVFDALNCLSLPDNSCDQEEGGYQYWSIGMIDVANGTILYPFPNQNPDLDLSYPRFAANNNFVIAFDVQDYTDFSTQGIRSTVVTANFEQQTMADVIDFGFGSRPFWGVPSFWGNDDFITVQVPVDSPAVVGAARVPLVADWAGDAARLDMINPFAVALPQMHRTGIRQLSGTVDASAPLLDFANVPLGESRNLSVVIKNNGNRDVRISNITTDKAAFTHNATNTLLPRGASMPITVSFKPETPGTQLANLLIDSDGEPRAVNVSLTGIGGNAASGPASPNTSQPMPGTGGGGGGGAFDLLMAIMSLVGAMALVQAKRRKTLKS